MSNGPKCRTCGREVAGCATTKFGGGWTHVHNNAERCPAPHRAFAAPVTLEDLNTKVLRDKAKARRRVKP